MKLSTAAAALLTTTSTAFVPPLAPPQSQKTRLTQKTTAVASIAPNADDLISKLERATDACIEKGECLVDDFLSLKTDLADTQQFFEAQIDAYGDADDDDDDEENPVDGEPKPRHVGTGASVERRAVRNYVRQMRDTHGAIAKHLAEVDGLLSKIDECRAAALAKQQKHAATPGATTAAADTVVSKPATAGSA
eukprot:CAMPEP_0185697512 /NCGR_PEP_ID=MMETSP1164-20130828/5794_1 /TAXON_ID=1104430 /ORGANISM="Chrysoreinhardia sp, Strain CCMP2950" /LENGTH=192 /DNA_ID=CAMNT_0028364409 /DNA_START=16 /DNA_END=594 /DNA_ORIENTATION=-